MLGRKSRTASRFQAIGMAAMVLAVVLCGSQAQAQGIVVQSQWNQGLWGFGGISAGTVRIGGWGPFGWGVRGWGGRGFGWGGWGWGAPMSPFAPFWGPAPWVPAPVFVPRVATAPIFAPPIVLPPMVAPTLIVPPLVASPFILAPAPCWLAPWTAQNALWGNWGGAPWLAPAPAAPLAAVDVLAGQRPLDNLRGDPLPPIREANADARARAARFFEIGDRYFDQQNYRQAYVRYDQATTAAPDMVEAQLRKGQSLIALGNYEMAARAFKMAVRSDNWTECRLRWDEIYGKNGAAKDAHVQALATAAHNDPNNADLMLLLGMELFFDDQIPRSAKFFERYAALRDAAPPAGNPPAALANIPVNAAAVANEDPFLPVNDRPVPQPPPAIGEARRF